MLTPFVLVRGQFMLVFLIFPKVVVIRHSHLPWIHSIAQRSQQTPIRDVHDRNPQSVRVRPTPSLRHPTHRKVQKGCAFNKRLGRMNFSQRQ